jgi:hypothetical protein
MAADLKLLPDKNTTAAFLLCGSLMILVFAFLVDLRILGGRTLILEGHPNYNIFYLFRTVLIALSSFLIVVNVVNYSAAISTDGSAAQKRAAGCCEGQLTNFQFILVAAVLLLSLYFLYLFYAQPKVFHAYSRETGVVEVYSARLLFLCCVIFSVTTVLLEKKRYKPIAFLFTVVFFVMAMEEVSWFQRALDIKTPEFFDSNLQGEINFHNFATNEVENMYYFSSFVFLALIPFIYDRMPSFKRYDFIAFFVPSRFVIFFSAVSVAYNYDMWNIPFTQFSFFITICIVAYYAWSCRGSGRSSLLLALIVGVCMLTQFVFLKYGGMYKKIWVVTEYKELFIPLSFTVYSVEVFLRARGLKRLPKS